MNLGDLVALSDPGIKPVLQHSQLVPLLELLDGGLDGTQTSDVVQQLLDVGFITLQIDQRTQHLWSGLSVDFEDIDLDIFIEPILVQVTSQFIDVTMNIT